MKRTIGTQEATTANTIVEKVKEGLKIKATDDNITKTPGTDLPKIPPRAKAKEEAKEREKANTEVKRAKAKAKVEAKDNRFLGTENKIKRKHR
jgi:hypothetical protein